MATAMAKIIYRSEKVSIISTTLLYSIYRKKGRKGMIVADCFCRRSMVSASSWGPFSQCVTPDTPTASSFLLPTSQQYHTLRLILRGKKLNTCTGVFAQ